MSDTLRSEIRMVDLKTQYLRLKNEIDTAIQEVVVSTQFIGGGVIAEFENQLSNYLGGNHVISCGNGTDALQIALMALELKQGDEVIVPAFSYAAPVEMAALMGLVPVYIDVSLADFNMQTQLIESAISEKTKAIIPVHLFGQQCDMKSIMDIAKKHNLYVIEDNAQSMGSQSSYVDSKSSIGHIATTSFFPSKNLACYGDGGALYCTDDKLANRIRKIANHGQSSKYIHDIIGLNSRLDSIQASILKVKLQYLDEFIAARKKAAQKYRETLSVCADIILPFENLHSDHVYHQFTLQVPSDRRDYLAIFLKEKRIPFAIYYPLACHQQEAYRHLSPDIGHHPNAESLCKSVISIPIHTELNDLQQEYICSNIKSFFNK